MIPSVDKGTHALNHDISVIFCVVLNQRTSKYASIVLLVNYRNIYGQGQRVGKKSIFVPARRLIDAYWTYAEGKQRNRDKNWLFSDRVYLCPLRVMRAILKPTDIRQSRKCLFFQHFRDFIRYSNSACPLLMLTIFV